MTELRWRRCPATATGARLSIGLSTAGVRNTGLSITDILSRSLLAGLVSWGILAAAAAPALAKETVSQSASQKPASERPVPAKSTQAAKAKSSARPVEITVRKGDTLTHILARQGIAAAERQAVLEALGDLFDPADLKAGDKIRLTLDRQNQRKTVRTIAVATGKADDLTVDVEPGQGLQAASPDQPIAARTALPSANANVEQEIEEAPQADSNGQPGAPSSDQAGSSSVGQFVVRRVAGIAGRDFRKALAATRLPAPLINEVLMAFKYDPDAPRVPPQNAAFSVIYEGVFQDGKVQEPQLRYATMNDGHKTHRVYRYQTDDATTAFIHANGQGIAFVDLDKPLRIDAKITSPYGWRIHPVFGDRRFHEGVDFGAPKGTPVIATADGRVDDIGWRGNYGEYIRLEHDSSLSTAYAHLSGFARGLRKGSTVKRGQVIGYVGRTGVATGPHLYYEVIVAGKRVDPMKVPPVVSVSLTGTQLAEFQKFVERAPEE